MTQPNRAPKFSGEPIEVDYLPPGMYDELVLPAEILEATTTSPAVRSIVARHFREIEAEVDEYKRAL